MIRFHLINKLDSRALIKSTIWKVSIERIPLTRKNSLSVILTGITESLTLRYIKQNNRLNKHFFQFDSLSVHSTNFGLWLVFTLDKKELVYFDKLEIK
ncbi:hypothetical protein BpHYR1_043322 [Brachionus plicatilis]|uniref:Uncharacterized protein n=1 Tax=Brachionus plicatilis TaxID=10195 RepID=A0A3M7QIS5_BRAPC|nr:hypothetical protein BpHYR1_043322 [Brachionus plicatilis]